MRDFQIVLITLYPYHKNFGHCKLLIPLAWLGFLYEFLDRWMLSLGSSEEQAYYALAANFAFIALIATSSIIKVLWKEIAEAYDENNQKS